MASVKIYGGCLYDNLILNEYDANEEEAIIKSSFEDNQWSQNTVFCANFNDENTLLSGSNFAGGFENIKKFKIYKKLSNQPQFHLVYNSEDVNCRVVEDFIVGDNCRYEYYIYPVCEKKGVPTISSPMKTEPITLDSGKVRVIGLIQDADNPDLYTIDENNVWCLDLNVVNEGFTNHMSKTFNDTLHAYQKEVQGNGNYRVFPLNGLLGKIDCTTGEYVDTYDDIIEWENFMNNGNLKVVVDLRGIITPGDFESNSFKYEYGAKAVSISCNFRQLNDINHITISAIPYDINPVRYTYLQDATSTFLADKDKTYLLGTNKVVK